MDLFSAQASRRAPLADRMRPRTLDEFIGQEHIVGKGRLLRRAIETDTLTSSIFFGPPGCGKTTLASVIAAHTGAKIAKLNAVTAGVKEVRAVIEQAEKDLKLYGTPTYLLLDECHRWSKTQSDSILPALESGIVRFIGSTTENPMVSMTGAVVSRCRLFQFYPLTIQDVEKAMRAALADKERGLGTLNIKIDDDAFEHIAATANGDARSALNALELAALTTAPDEEGCIHIDAAVAAESVQKKVVNVDDEQFYNMLSAFCKSLRGGDSDAAIAWFARLVYAGVDPRVICRRLIAHASEDVGLANPQAMTQAVAAAQALELIGMPEARLSITQAIIFICESPKSNSVVMAMDAAFADAERIPDQPVPMHLRDTAYKGADKLGNGKGYKYPHDYPGHVVQQEYMPPSVKGRRYYIPGELGNEGKIRQNHIRNGKIEE
ncbi:MAG: replication-associated recombination protein A [Eubacteriales bacterium]|jgi:putative ATPase|nr:replication-associated recombination protein A [Eubacteriales bacterium]MCI6123555.1 replication-associated recombination protein A [Christensenellaceae bacterium]PWM45461.1 MAG: replication-associated recombination protein RarA [Clostridia bacterium]MCI6670892.1 replication-associated recombination protein A [Christensenellaceae bacterium]MCI7375432.1 replication-associated recombination protein A [Christensenellaceae bacterium]